MATTTKDTTPASLPLRLHLVEEKLNGFIPPEGQDLTAVTTSLTRLYKLTMQGAVAFAEEPITWDMPDNELQYLNMNASLHSLVLGDYIADYGLQTQPFISQVLGGEEDGQRFSTRSVVNVILSGTSWEFETTDAGNNSLAHRAFGSPSRLSEMLNDPETPYDSLLAYIQAVDRREQLHYEQLSHRMDGLEQRIDILESWNG